MTVVDCQFIFGDIKFISSYFENEEEKKEIISIFQEFLNEPDRQTTFKNLNRFIRLIP